MITIDYGHCKISYDETIEVGDLITAYQKGFFQVTKIISRGNGTPSFEYIQVLKENGTKGSGKPKACDASYCTKLDVATVQAMYNKEIEELHLKRDALLEFAKTTSGNPVPRVHLNPECDITTALTEATKVGSSAYDYFIKDGRLPGTNLDVRI